jgi:hypothetical protein
VVDHLEHCLKALLHQPDLHQHDDDLPEPATTTATIEEGSAPAVEHQRV